MPPEPVSPRQFTGPQGYIFQCPESDISPVFLEHRGIGQKGKWFNDSRVSFVEFAEISFVGMSNGTWNDTSKIKGDCKWREDYFRTIISKYIDCLLEK
ncbi:hypothetical protein CDAR_202181 [Caerostris darwini]|uniref:Uncharacterized protein n=1 Tax=Caerostris darwini TaxID=1538125 RepID=A0AAV4RKH2_9ARAC|nr:hypothetical protein CDAR_202181 [Caerostris darwini]